MFVKNTSNYSHIISIDLESIQKFVLKIQQNIYLAAKQYNLDKLYFYQRKLLLQKELLLLIIYKIINFLKKKRLS